MAPKDEVVSIIQSLLNVLPMRRADMGYKIKLEALINDRLNLPVRVDRTHPDDYIHIDGEVEYPDELVKFHINIEEKNVV